MKKLFALFLLIPFWLAAANTVASADATMTKIAAVESWYIKAMDPMGLKARAVGLWLNYSVGNGTSVAITFQFAKTASAPGATDLFGFVERQYDNTIAAVTVTFSATAKNYLWIEVPAEATYMAVTIAFTGGTTQTLDLSAKIGGRN